MMHILTKGFCNDNLNCKYTIVDIFIERNSTVYIGIASTHSFRFLVEEMVSDDLTS